MGTGGFILTSKEAGKTKSRYIRVGMLKEVRSMTRRNRKLKSLLRELAEVNWELLKAQTVITEYILKPPIALPADDR